MTPGVRAGCYEGSQMGKLGKYKDKIRRVLREWIWMCRYIRKYWLGVASFVLIGIISVVMSLLTAVASKDLINVVTMVNGAGERVKDTDRLFSAMLFMIGLVLGQIAFNAVASWITTLVRVRVQNEVRAEVFEKIMMSRWESLRDYHSGEIVNRLEGDVSGVVNGVIGFLPGLITQSVKFLGSFVIILCYDWVMALFALISAPILVLSARPMMRIMRRFNEKNRKINGEILSFNEEAFQNIQLVKAFDLTKQRCRLLGELLNKHKEVQVSYAKVSVWVSVGVGVLGIIAGYGCYGWAIYRLWTDVIDYGQMTMFLQLSSYLSTSFSALASLVPSAISTATAAGRIMEVTQLPAEQDADAAAAKKMLKKARETGVVVEAADLCFAYQDAPSAVMDHVSFTAKPGEIVAFVGPSGGGKTTMLRLLLGLLCPQDGALTVRLPDGSAELPVSDSTRRLCAYVPQGNSVFSGTIRENLTAVAPRATDEAIRTALEAADAWDFVSKQPEGIDTVLGERGVNLSEGQLQRLAIARALLRKAPVLIMDEATSALDTETEARVLRAVMKDDPDRVCLLTTHRSSMLAYADQIIQVNGDGHFSRLDPAAYRRETV